MEGIGSMEGNPTGARVAVPGLPGSRLGRLILAAVLCGVLSVVAWLPFGMPGRLLHSVLFSRSVWGGLSAPLCSSAGSSARYTCSVERGLNSVAPAIALSVGLFLVRRRLGRGVRRLLGSRLPQRLRFLVAPLAATAAFGVSWGYVHRANPWSTGVVPEILFPAAVGLLTFATLELGPALMTSADRAFASRDRVPVWLRLILVLAATSLVSFAVTRSRPVTHVELKQQAIVIISLLVGFPALMPRPRESAVA